jgi:hypothetical protein
MKIIIPIIILFAVLAPAAHAADPAGYALLDQYVACLKEFMENGGANKTDEVLDPMMAAARKARDEKRIDATFFDRYTRVLAVFKLAILKDKERILSPIIDREIQSFSRDIMGRADIPPSIEVFASALAKEMDNLRTYLDKH